MPLFFRYITERLRLPLFCAGIAVAVVVVAAVVVVVATVVAVFCSILCLRRWSWKAQQQRCHTLSPNKPSEKTNEEPAKVQTWRCLTMKPNMAYFILSAAPTLPTSCCIWWSYNSHLPACLTMKLITMTMHTPSLLLHQRWKACDIWQPKNEWNAPMQSSFIALFVAVLYKIHLFIGVKMSCCQICYS